MNYSFSFFSNNSFSDYSLEEKEEDENNYLQYFNEETYENKEENKEEYNQEYKEDDLFSEDELQKQLDMLEYITDDEIFDSFYLCSDEDLIEQDQNKDQNKDQKEIKKNTDIVCWDSKYFSLDFFDYFLFDYPSYNSIYVKKSLRNFVVLETKQELKPYIEYLNKEINLSSLKRKFMYYPAPENTKFKLQTILNRTFIIISYNLNYNMQIFKYYEVIENRHIRIMPKIVKDIFDEYFLKFYTTKSGVREIKYILTLKEI